MKVNLKKIGVVVAGAAILASSAAFGALYFGSTKLVDDNGAPLAKIVIGSNAAPSDGVAAALIAGKLASSAWTTQTLTAQISGTPACLASNASATGGSCSITNQSAQLEITVPGSVSTGTWTGSNLIGDYIDRTLGDRLNHSQTSDTTSFYPLDGGADTSTTENPFTDGLGDAGGNIGGPGATALYQVNGGSFAPFATQTVTDTAVSKTYSEEQTLWFGGDNHFDSSPNQVVGNVNALIYAIKFDGPGSGQIGIPICTTPDDNLNYANCSDIDYLTATHQVNISFLGSNWIISNMIYPQGTGNNDDGGFYNVSNSNQVVPGGEVDLAQESASGIINVGQSLPAGSISVRLDDIEAVSGADGVDALISMVDANGNVLLQDKIAEGSTGTETVNGQIYRIHVYKVAPGYTFGAKWADMAVYQNELDLISGQELDQADATNPDYNVVLGWKTQSQNAGGIADSLRSILIYGNNLDALSSDGSAESMTAGSSMPIVQNPALWELTYHGLNLQSSEMSQLTFNLETDSRSLGSSNGPYNVSANGVRINCTINAPYLEVTSSDPTGVFSVPRTDGGQSTDLTYNSFLVALNSAAGQNAADCGFDELGSGTNTNRYPAGTIFMQESESSSNWGAAYPSNNVSGVQYSKIGDGSDGFVPGSGSEAGGGAIVFQGLGGMSDNDATIGQLLNSSLDNGHTFGSSFFGGTVPNMTIAIAEKAGSGTSNNYVDYYVFGVADTGTGSPGDATFEFDAYNGSTSGKHLFSSSNQILYGHATSNAPNGQANSGFYNESGGTSTGPVTGGIELVDQGYVSERGSEFQTQSANTVTFNMAEALGQAVWTLNPVSNSTSATSSGQVVTLTPGESATVSGVTVQLLGINEAVGACNAAGAAASCNIDPTSYSAVIVPGNTPSVNVSVPYTGDYGNLVILDSDAVGVNTLVSVGGPVVNSETASLLQGSTVDWNANPVMVQEVVQGSKIVVAGAQASDTLTAAQDFVNQLSTTPSQ